MVLFIFLKLTAFFLLLTKANSIFNFSYPDFKSNEPDILLEANASVANGVLQLTTSVVSGNFSYNYGRASYNKTVQLYDPDTRDLTNFTTQFSFVIDGQNQSWSADGLAFFIAPFDARIPPNSEGGSLGLFPSGSEANNSTTRNGTTSTNSTIAVEFDTFPNTFPNGFDPSSNHIGIDIDSIASVTTHTLRTSMANASGGGNALVSYDSASQNLSVFVSFVGNSQTSGENASLHYKVDLRDFLPDKVRVGFSAATGSGYQLHKVKSWSFNSTLESSTNTNNTNSGGSDPISEPGESKAGLWIGLGVGFGILTCGLGLVWFLFCRRRNRKETDQEEEDYDSSIDGEFERGAGPKRFTYRELSYATNNFNEERKLGEGGFGGVYKGLLSESNMEVAVKRVSKGSMQGKKEYISEVKIISRLRHRNLVQLIGWCHRQGEFILVYEYLPNGSLDSYLFGEKLALPWVVRHKITLGLASAILYLHEEWEQCIVHRDMKSSNIMLDSNFNAKLGDFGLARLVDHERGLDTTAVAGTRGYMAPECFETGKASKESDVYSFGVVALEISCGRRPIVANVNEPIKVRLVEWVWELYGKGHLLEAIDKRLSVEFDNEITQIDSIERLMIVGLWCCHPDPTCRPSIKQVMSVLNFEAPLPKLPPSLPVPTYEVPSFNISLDSHSSSVYTGSTQDTSSTSTSSKPFLKFADQL